MAEEEIKVKIKLEFEGGDKIEKEAEKLRDNQQLEKTRSEKQEAEDKATPKTSDQTKKDLTGIPDSNLEELESLTRSQAQNVAEFARNPTSFVFGNLFKRFAKGAGAVTLALILFEAVKTIVDELFKRGRLLDTAFREVIDKQIVIFFDRKQQQELKQRLGKQVITSTLGTLRGSKLRGQIGGNFYTPNRISLDFIDNRRPRQQNILTADTRGKSFFGFYIPGQNLVME